MGAIVIEGIEGWGHHGVLPHEREQGQRFLVDVRLDVDTSRAADTDELEDAVDYGHVARAVHAVVVGEPVNLIETLADRVLKVCMDDERVREAAVVVRKPEAPLPVPASEVRVERRMKRR
jgi:dihydroneopterin aldolase